MLESALQVARTTAAEDVDLEMDILYCKGEFGPVKAGMCYLYATALHGVGKKGLLSHTGASAIHSNEHWCFFKDLTLAASCDIPLLSFPQRSPYCTVVVQTLL